LRGPPGKQVGPGPPHRIAGAGNVFADRDEPVKPPPPWGSAPYQPPVDTPAHSPGEQADRLGSGAQGDATKSGKVQRLTLPSTACAALRRYRLAQAEHLLSVGVRQDASTAVVADPIGRPMALHRLNSDFRAFCQRHRFDISFHALRHSNAVAMLTSGVDVKTAASRLGHSNPEWLLRTYAHYIRSADKAAGQRGWRGCSAARNYTRGVPDCQLSPLR